MDTRASASLIIPPSPCLHKMNSCASKLWLPTQIRDYSSAVRAIRDAREKVAKDPASLPTVTIPTEHLRNYMRTLEAYKELADVMEHSLHKVYLCLAKDHFEDVVGLILDAQMQSQLCAAPATSRHRFVFTFQELHTSFMALQTAEAYLSVVISWTASEEGTALRRKFIRVHADMEASLDNWIAESGVLPKSAYEQRMEELAFEQELESFINSEVTPEPFPPASVPPSLTARRSSLPDLSIKVPKHTEYERYPVITPPPLSPFMKSEETSTTCVHGADCLEGCRLSRYKRVLDDLYSGPKTPKPFSGLSPHPRKRSRFTPSMDNEAMLVCSGDSDDGSVVLLDNVRASSPSEFESSSDSSSEDGRSVVTSFWGGSGELEMRPLLRPRTPRPQSTPVSAPLPSPSPPKSSSWLRILKDLFPFF